MRHLVSLQIRFIFPPAHFFRIFFFVFFFEENDAWDSYCADKQLQISLARQLVGGWVVKTRRRRGGGQTEAIQGGGKKKPSVAILPLLMVQRNQLHPASRHLGNISALWGGSVQKERS